jgi:hypothetical protein
MLTALVLQLIQCVVVLPERFQSEGTEKSNAEGKENEEDNKDKLVHVGGRYILRNIICNYEIALGGQMRKYVS